MAAPPAAPPKYTPIQGPQVLQPGNINATAPAPWQMFGNIAQIDPTYYSSVNANPFQQQQYLKQYDNLYTKGLQPFFNQQLLQNSQDLAARGIGNSSAANYSQANLQGQQAGQVAQGEAPMVQQAFAQTQQDILQNAQLGTQANAANAAAANNAAAMNANYYTSAVGQNFDAYNAYQSALFNQGAGEQNALLGAYLNTFAPNPALGSLYGGMMSGMSGAYDAAYSSLAQGQGTGAGGIGTGLGNYFGMASMGGAGAGAADSAWMLGMA